MSSIPTSEIVSSIILDFGKHKGKSLEELASSQEGLSYMEWLLKQHDVGKKPYYAELLRRWSAANPDKQPPMPPDVNIIQFGTKYKGKHVDEVVKDISFVKWVIDQPFFKYQPEVIRNRFREALDEHSGASGLALVGEEPITFGKYRGKKPAEMLKDVEYCKFLVQSEWFKKNLLYKAVLRASEGHPMIEEDPKQPQQKKLVPPGTYALAPGTVAFDPKNFGAKPTTVAFNAGGVVSAPVIMDDGVYDDPDDY